jgi:hypothetical protein
MGIAAGAVAWLLSKLSIRRLGWLFVAAHPDAWRVDQTHRFAIIPMRMFRYVFVAEIATFVFFVNTFYAQPLRQLAAFLANNFWHPVARQQDEGIFGGRFSFPEANHFDVRLGCDAKIVKMAQNQDWLEYCISFALLAYIFPSPTTNCDLTQVIAAFQPDGAQGFIKRSEPTISRSSQKS